MQIWPYPRANGDYSIDMLERLRARYSERPLKLIWDGASYHRSAKVGQRAAELNIDSTPIRMTWLIAFGSRISSIRRKKNSASQSRCGLEADIRGYFDAIVREQLMELIEKRVRDGSILRLIRKWIDVGVIDQGRLLITETGTGQGQIISPAGTGGRA